jgi:hypothetical protein
MSFPCKLEYTIQYIGIKMHSGSGIYICGVRCTYVLTRISTYNQDEGKELKDSFMIIVQVVQSQGLPCKLACSMR